MIAKLLSLVALTATACSSPVHPDDGNPVIGAGTDTDVPALVEAERKLRAGDAYAALDVTDAILRARPDDRPARLLAARANAQLGSSGVSGAEQFLATAANQFERALGIDRKDADALTDLARVRLALRQYRDGRDAAVEAAHLAQAAGDRKRVSAALLVAASNEMQIFVAARSPELAAGKHEPTEDTGRLGLGVIARLRSAQSAGASSGSAMKRVADVLRWLGRDSEALGELENAVRSEPSSAEANAALQDLWWQMNNHLECVGAYKRMVSEAPSSAPLRFYLGRAEVALADRMRREGRWAEAVRAYENALETWRTYDAAKPADRALSSHWMAICELSIARSSLEQGELVAAEAQYLAALATDQRVAEFDADGRPRIYDSFGGNYLGGLGMIGERLSNARSDTPLEDTLAFWRRVLARHPGRFGAAYNNAALAARDLGAKLAGPADSFGGPKAVEASEGARRSQLEQAMALWEQSYAWYETAVGLEPNDPRIVNDCGLMLIYHLHRDYERARACFDRAIELGEQQLADLPRDADESQREFLEEATGDAWQNVGVLLQKRLGRPAAEWKPFYEKAVEFYPYQRREAARELARLESGIDQDKPDPRKPKFDAEIVKAEAAAAQADWDGALTVLDRIKQEMNGYAPYHWKRGIYSLRFAQQAAQNGGDVGLVDGLFTDAVRQLQRAVELDDAPFEPRLALGEAQLVRGLYADASKTIDSLLSHARSRGGASPDQLLAAHTVRAEAAARAFIASQQADDDAEKAAGKELLTSARESMQEVEKAGALDAPLRDTWIAAERWADANAQAIAIMVRAYRNDAANIGTLVDLGAQTGESEAVLEALKDADDSTSLWYRGRASFDRGVQQWASGEGKAGVATFDAAIALFERSMADNRDFTNSCQQWIALTHGQKGIVQTSIDDLDGAETSLIAAMKQRPDVFTNDLGNGASIRRAVLVLADRFYAKQDLGRVAAIYRVAGATAPDDVQIANNEGLFCRDHAERIARTDPKLANELFEASYAAYSRAVAIDGENARLLNDCALILVHYLDRDADKAQAMLDRAVVVGEKQLRDDPPADAQEKRDLQEAVGDAYGNLGRLYLRMKNDLKQARANYEKSLEFYPFQRREASRTLPEIDRLEKKDGEK